MVSNQIILKEKKEFSVIKKSLEVAVLQNKPQVFLPYLLLKNVFVKFPNKLAFYSFFNTMLKSAQNTRKGKLHLKIEFPDSTNKFRYEYHFFDMYHKYSRVYIVIEENPSQINFDILPF